MERQPVVKCLVGSHNYNLNEPTSDRDYKLFVMPTFDDLYYRNEYSKSILGTDEDVDIHDIRKVAHLWWKSNLNFIEVLYSTDVQFLCDAPELSVIWSMKHELVTMNLPYLWNACIGMHHNKMKLLHKGTEGTQHLVDQYGYDTKQALHAFRILDFLKRFADTDFVDFQYAMTYQDSERDKLLAIKHGKFTLEHFEEYIMIALDYMKSQYESLYVSQSSKEYIKKQLEELIYSMVENRIVKGMV